MRRLTAIASFALMLSSSIAASQDAASQVSQEVVSAQSADASARFEGFVYLDTDGRPLPFQDDGEIESFLADAEVARAEFVPTGITGPRKLTLEGEDFEVFAIFKDVDVTKSKFNQIVNGRKYFFFEWKDHYRYEIAGYELDRMLGLDRVPPSVERTFEGSPGVISIWVSNSVNEFERTRDLKVEPPDTRRWNQQRLLMQLAFFTRYQADIDLPLVYLSAVAGADGAEQAMNLGMGLQNLLHLLHAFAGVVDARTQRRLDRYDESPFVLVGHETLAQLTHEPATAVDHQSGNHENDQAVTDCEYKHGTVTAFHAAEDRLQCSEDKTVPFGYTQMASA